MDQLSLAREYCDFLVTCEIAVALARQDNRPENKTLRECIKVLLKRSEHKEVKLIFKGIKKANYPVGALCKMRREFNEVLIHSMI